MLLPAWLRNARTRDLFLIVVGAVGVLISSTILCKLIYQTYGEWRERNEQEHLREWQSWEKETRRSLAEHKGVRGIELSSLFPHNPQARSDSAAIAPPEGYRGLTLVSLEIRSDPPGAEVFLDWASKGKTPIRLEGESITGLLLILKKDHQAWFRQVRYQTSDALNLDLPREPQHPSTRLLLLVSGESFGDSFSFLQKGLREEGFVVPGPEEARDFQKKEQQRKECSPDVFRAWARTRFDTDFLVIAHVRQSSRAIAEQEFGLPDIGEAVRGVVRANVHIALEVFDLRAGQVVTITGEGTDFALDQADSIHKALTKAATNAAKRLRKEVQG